jgi:hypothetical protein
VCSAKEKPGKYLNVEIAMWDCVLTPASGCFTPNPTSQTNMSQGEADYSIVSAIFHYVWIFFEYQYVLCKKG